MTLPKNREEKKFIDCGVVSLSHLDRSSVRPRDTLYTDRLVGY